jgi:cold shock CspA family protein
MGLANNVGELVKIFPNFGFIRFENRNVFVHKSNYLSGFTPEVGQIVRFDFALALNNRPPHAVKVRVIKSRAAVIAENEIRHGLEALQKSSGAR